MRPSGPVLLGGRLPFAAGDQNLLASNLGRAIWAAETYPPSAKFSWALAQPGEMGLYILADGGDEGLFQAVFFLANHLHHLLAPLRTVGLPRLGYGPVHRPRLFRSIP